MTIMPAEGFARGNRSGVRPTAPGRELSDWINKGARSGLPEMKPSPVAAAPELAENDRRRSRRVAAPANEIIRRPIVTRNPDADSPARAGAPRERRVISPRNPEAVTQGPALRERGPSRGPERGQDRRPKPPAPSADSQAGADSGGGRTSPKIRVPLPAPSEKTDGNPAARERKRAHEGDSAAETPVRKPDANTDAGSEDRGRARREQSPAPKPRESNPSGDQQRDNETRSRERRPPTSDAKPREDAQPRSRAEEPARSHDRGASPPQAAPRQEPQIPGTRRGQNRIKRRNSARGNNSKSSARSLEG
jgi:hypothetical protein